MKILAIDQARELGFALYDNERLLHCSHKMFGDGNYEKILSPVTEYVAGLIKETQAELILIEDIQYQSNKAVYKKLAWLQGTLICHLNKNNYLYDIVAPTKWRSFCGIGGRKRMDQKESAIKFVEKHFGMKLTNDNVAEAICMGWYGVHEVVKKINMDNGVSI